MTTHRQATVGIFERPGQAREALLALREAGFPAGAISILTPEGQETGIRVEAPGTTAGRDASAGAVIGGLLGSALGWLGALGALAIPGIGPVVGAGALVAMLGARPLARASERSAARWWPWASARKRLAGPSTSSDEAGPWWPWRPTDATRRHVTSSGGREHTTSRRAAPTRFSGVLSDRARTTRQTGCGVRGWS